MLNLKALLTKILIQITPTDVVNGNCTFRQVGNIVYISASTNITVNANTYTNWFTVGTQYRPSAERFVPCFVGSSANIPALIRIQPSGQVSVFCANTFSTVGIWLSGCYIL